MLLDKIKKANDIKKIKKEDYKALAKEIREFLLDTISVTGGHLGSNLGVVELTMALHICLNLPNDKIVWDVGHQAYTHKLLTGRKDGFEQLRKYGGLSGFPKRKESACDCFDTGHSSTSISAGLGLVKARDLAGEKRTIVSVIGDGSLTGGMAYEALNNAAQLKSNFIIVLNDNSMSISKNVGGVSNYLNNIRTKSGYLDIKEGVYNRLSSIPKGEQVIRYIQNVKSSFKHIVIPGMFFEDMGITYLGPVDGHDVEAMIKVLSEAKRCRHAVLIHIKTKKGKGYEPAEKYPSRFHGAEPFVLETGLPSKPKKGMSYTDVFSKAMLEIGSENQKVVGITAAMSDGTGLAAFEEKFPGRFFDVGIAEQHAVTFAAGLAAGGRIPVVAVYSSFLQRAYDQILHDVCIQNLPVVFAIDRAGLVGSDGETHQGIFDFSYLSSIPNMHIMAPKNGKELIAMMKFAVEFGAPIAVRYPRGNAYEGLEDFQAQVTIGKSEVIYEEEDIALLAAGSMVKTAVEVRHALKEMGYSCSLVNARFVKPIDEEMVQEVSKTHKLIVTMEENVGCGGFGEKVRACVDEHHIKTEVICISLPDDYVEHGNVDILYQEVGIDTDSIVKKIVTAYGGVL